CGQGHDPGAAGATARADRTVARRASRSNARRSGELRPILGASRHDSEVRGFGYVWVHAGKIEKDRAKSVSGLFGGVRAATSAADRALLLADRAMFLTHRMPFLIRAQARLGAQEIMDDALHRLNDVDALLARKAEVQPVVNDLSGLLTRSEAAARETRKLLETLA